MLTGYLLAGLSLAMGAVGSVGAFALTMFTKVGDSLLKYKFDQQLEKYKGELNREIERLKASLSHLTDRGVRSNQLEYEALTAAWEQYVTTYRLTQQCVIRLIEHPDFSQMNDTQLGDYLSTTEFSEQQQSQMLRAKDKADMFAKINQLRAIAAAGGAIYDAHQVIANRGIFIPEDLETAFREAITHCSKIWAIEKVSFAHRGQPSDPEQLPNLMLAAPGIRESLKVAVRNRMLASFSNQPG